MSESMSTVKLGWGGNFTFEADLASVQTDARGHYVIDHVLTYNGPCPYVWLRASAAGHVSNSDVHVSCDAPVLTIDLGLVPTPE